MVPRPKLLILNLYMVYPPNSGAKVVIYNRIVELSKYFDITFCCLQEHESDLLSAKELSHFAKVVLVPYIRRQKSFLTRIIEQLRNPSSTDLGHIFYDWIESPVVAKLIDEGEFDLIESVSACWFHKVLLRSAAKISIVALNYEGQYYAEKARACVPVFNIRGFLRAIIDTILVGIQERRAIRAAHIIVTVYPPAKTPKLFSKMRPMTPLIENSGGLDLNYYTRPGNPSDELSKHGDPRLLFISTMFIESSVEAAIAFAREVLPAVRERYPNAEFWVVGDHRGNKDLLHLAKSDSSVKLFGLVDDTRRFLAAAEIVVVPILHGSGVRYKILEALAAGKAVVTTSKGTEGLRFRSGEDLIITNSVGEMLEPILLLLKDTDYRAKLARNGLRAVSAQYNREALLRDLSIRYYKAIGISPDLIDSGHLDTARQSAS